MKKIFIGLLFVLLDFNLTVGSSVIGLIPDFVGGIFMLKGADELADKSDCLAKAHPWMIGYIVYSGVLYALDLLGFSASLGWLGVLLSVVGMVLMLCITYRIVQGVCEMENRFGAKLNGAELKAIWTPLAIVEVVGYIGVIVPIVLIICVAIAFILSIIFLVRFNTAKKLYEALISEAT